MIFHVLRSNNFLNQIKTQMTQKEFNTKPVDVKKELISNKVVSISAEKKLFFSIKSGIFAFSIVLILCSIFKILAVSSSSITHFEISGNDLIYSFWAFIVISFIELAHYFKS